MRIKSQWQIKTGSSRGTHQELAAQAGLYQDFLCARKEASGWKLAK